MKVYLATLATLLLSVSTFAAEKPNFNIPADAQKSLDSCVTVSVVSNLDEKTAIWSPWQTKQEIENTFDTDWSADGTSFQLSENISGNSLSLIKIKMQYPNENLKQKIMVTENWSLINDKWTPSNTDTLVTLSRKDAVTGDWTILSRQLNGVEKPYTWVAYTAEFSPAKAVTVFVNNLPGKDDTKTTKTKSMFTTCEYVNR